MSDSVGYGMARSGSMMSAAGFTSGRGGLGFVVVIDMPYEAELDGPFWQHEPAGYAGDLGRERTPWKALGFIFVRLPVPNPARGWAVAVPMWVLLLALAAVPGWHFWGRPRRERRRRERLGLCLRCGYDLRASSDRCPECGEPVPATRCPTPTLTPTSAPRPLQAVDSPAAASPLSPS